MTKMFVYRDLFLGIPRLLVDLKELELIFPTAKVEAILNSLPSQLISLYLRFAPSKKQADAISLYCKRLRRLEMRIGRHELEQFFASDGPGLEHLALSRRISRGMPLCLGHVKKYGRHLNSFSTDVVSNSLSQGVTDL